MPTNEDGVVIPQSQVVPPASPAVQAATSPAASPGVLSAPVTRTYELPPVTSGGTATAPSGAPDMPACFRFHSEMTSDDWGVTWSDAGGLFHLARAVPSCMEVVWVKCRLRWEAEKMEKNLHVGSVRW